MTGGVDDTPDLSEEEKIVSLVGGNIVIKGDVTIHELGFGATFITLDVCYAIYY